MPACGRQGWVIRGALGLLTSVNPKRALRTQAGVQPNSLNTFLPPPGGNE